MLGLVVAGCSGQQGNVELDVVSPGTGSVFAGLTTVRLSVVREGAAVLMKEGPVGAAGQIDVDLSIPATGVLGDVRLEGLDAAGTVKVRGRLPPMELVSSTGVLKLWVAPVGASAKLPATLPVAVAKPAGVALPAGALLAGGAAAGDVASTQMLIWNQFFLELQPGAALPGARKGLCAVGTDVLGGVLLFGGADDTGAVKADLWRFDTTAPPMGTYSSIAVPELAALARRDARAVQLGDLALVAGGSTATGSADGALLIELPSVTASGRATFISATARSAPALAASGGGVVVAGGGPAERFLATPTPAFSPISGPAVLETITGSAAATLPDGRVVIAGGRLGIGASGNPSSRSLFVYAPTPTPTITELPDALATGRTDATVTVVGGELLVAGGRDMLFSPLADAEVFDATTLARLRVIPLSGPRFDHTAILLGNGTVLLAGGQSATDTPLATLELYTPEKL